MVKKIILHSIGNQDDFNYYIFDKNQKVMEVLSKILAMDFNIYLDEDCPPDKKKKININKKIDLHESDNSGNFRIDIFFGNKKIFLTIYCPESLRLKFNESLFKYTKMSKPIKIKKRKFRRK